jgi:hypothetical protein
MTEMNAEYRLATEYIAVAMRAITDLCSHYELEQGRPAREQLPRPARLVFDVLAAIVEPDDDED